MTEHRTDPLLERAIQELQVLPIVMPGTAEQVATTAMATRRGEGGSVGYRARWWKRLTYVAVGAAACAAGFLARGIVQRTIPMAPLAAASHAGAFGQDLELTANVTSVVHPLAWQFVFHDPNAHSVAMVADFNGWNPDATPLVREPGSSLWSVIVPVMPGRHAYAFVVDDTSFLLDPNAAVTRDPDLGTKESVVVVGRP
jgi:Carbohydrate-binding module 48 (Isoamylase N-terminal domain)